MVDLNEYLKYRKCTIAVIDSGINIENAILKRHLWKNTDEKIDILITMQMGMWVTYVDIILKITTLNCFLMGGYKSWYKYSQYTMYKFNRRW